MDNPNNNNNNDPPPVRENAVGGSQLGSIEKFDPQKEGSDVEVWCASMDTAKATFAWTDQQAATAAKSRLAGQAAQWLLNEQGEGNNYNAWATPVGLKLALITRFKIQVTYQNAATLMADLHQKPTESVASYYDRVRSAIIVKNKVVFNTEQRESPWFKQVLQNDYKTFFIAGLKMDIKSRLPQPYPENIVDLLSIAVGVEAEAKKTKFSIDEVTEQPTATDKHEEKSINELIKDLGKEIATLKVSRQPFDPRNAVCWNCGKAGHVRQKCLLNRNRKGRFTSNKKKRPQPNYRRPRVSINEVSGNEFGEW